MPQIDDIIHGTCGNCGGAVVTPRVWMGLQRPTPTCESCGARAAPAYGPRMEMMPSEPDLRSVTLPARIARGSSRQT